MNGLTIAKGFVGVLMSPLLLLFLGFVDIREEWLREKEEMT